MKPTRSVVLAVTIVILLAVNMLATYLSGQHATMYANPIYRWRESMAIALSRLQDRPAGGYVAYRSIRDYLAQHGLGLMNGEATPLPTPKELIELVSDKRRMEKLLDDARHVPINHGLPHVALAGNEKGLADYYYWAFRLFGVNLSSLVLFYYLLLSLSVVLFFIAFRDSPFAVLLLMLCLIAHLYMVDYANNPLIHTIHNSRFLPALSVLPTMHLLLLLTRGQKPTPLAVTIATIQVSLFSFVVFCRLEAVWEGFAVVASGTLLIKDRAIWNAIWGQRRASTAVNRVVMKTWPALLVVAGLLGVVLYSTMALDKVHYATETKTHAFWHSLFGGMVGASPQLSKIFANEPGEYTDSVGYFAVLADLRARNEVPPEIAFRHDGVIYINAMRNMGVYDQFAKRVFFNTVKQHPWLALKSFLYDKPRDQIRLLDEARVLSIRRSLFIIPLSLGVTLVAMWCGLRVPRRDDLRRALPIIGVVALWSWLPTMIAPSAYIVDAILFHLMVFLLYVVYLHVVAARYVWGSGDTCSTS